MFKITRTGIFIMVILLVFGIIQVFIHKYSIESEIGTDIMKKQEIEQEEIPIIKAEVQTWQIQIPKISLIADISEGTTKDVLERYVGHFKTTAIKTGNVVLAAYNRGNEVNYFKDLKLLKKGDEIIYKYNEFQKIYKVEKCRIIRDTELQYLEEDEENILTLITWVENQPEYRRCIKAEEVV